MVNLEHPLQPPHPFDPNPGKLFNWRTHVGRLNVPKVKSAKAQTAEAKALAELLARMEKNRINRERLGKAARNVRKANH